MKKGKVYLVGAGPGDPGLLTIRAREVLSKAQVVVHDALIHSSILGLVPPEARKIFRGKRGKRGALSQGQINSLLVRLAKGGQQVVRLKGGDPFVFGRGAEEAMELRAHGIDLEVVPGVTSAIAVPAYAGIPVTHRAMNSSFTVITGHEDPGKSEPQIDWQSLAANNGTLVFLMGLHTLPLLCERLIGEGKPGDTPAAVIQSGTTSRQRTVKGKLSDIAALVEKEGLKPPATFVVGRVVELMEKVNWTGRKPLFGRRVLVTRTREQASSLSAALSERGAEVIEIPTIEIVPLPPSAKVKNWLRNIHWYDWVVFTSVNSVEIFMKELFRQRQDVRDLKNAKVACVGESTAKAVRASGIQPEIVPKDYKQEGLAAALKNTPWKGKRVLLTRAREGRDVLLDFFKKKGAMVDFWPLYKNCKPAGTREKLLRLFRDEDGVDLLIFASSSSVDNLYGFFSPAERRQWLKGLPAAVIGPVTASSVRKWAGKVAIQPKKYTMSALVSAIERWASRHRV